MTNPYFSMLGTAWKFSLREKKRFVFIYVLFIAANIAVAFYPILYGWFIDGLQREGADILSCAWIYAGAYLALKLIEWGFHGPARVMERKLAFNLSQNFLEDLYHKVLHLPLEWHKDHHSGATINRIKKAYDALRLFFQNGFTYLYGLCKFLFSFAAIVYFSPLFGSIGVVLGIITIYVITKFDKPYIKTLKEVNEGQHKVSSNLFDCLSNIVSVITLRLEKRMELGLSDKVTEIFPSFKKNVVINEWKWFAAQMLVSLIYVVITVGYVYQNWVPGEVFYIGGLVTMLGFVMQFTSVFYDIASQYTQVIQYNTDVQTANGIIEEYQKIHAPKSGKVASEEWQSIEIRNLNYLHPEGLFGEKRPSGLHNFNMRILKGQKIALIGESGSGKSTLLSILRGLYPVKQGLNMAIDGENGFCIAGISETVTLLPQEPEIFENTLRYNITLGLPFPDEEVNEVCEAAQLTEIINSLPNGLETQIIEKGLNLSGGQKQRLALARGILAAKNSSIVLMDEPTSSVDPKTEMLLYQKMFKVFEGKAVVSSLHRLHLLSHFDYIYVLNNGKIADEGSFEELRLRSPFLIEVWQQEGNLEVA